MIKYLLPLMALISGAAIATQAALNSQLGSIVKNSFFASLIAFFSSFVFTLLAFFLIIKEFPGLHLIKQVPFHLWFSGGLLSAFAIGSVYWLIPRMGITSLISYFLTGQLLLAVFAGHFGLFQSPIQPITLQKIVGTISLIFGIILIQKG